MNEKIINCFVSSAMKVLSTEMGSPIAVGAISSEGAQYSSRGVTALIGVTGQLRGMVYFGLSRETALGLVSQMVGEPYHEMDEVAQSGIAELGNVVVGSSVTCLEKIGYECGITPPAVIVGDDASINTPNMPRLVVPLSTPSGTVEMQLALRLNGIH